MKGRQVGRMWKKQTGWQSTRMKYKLGELKKYRQGWNFC